MKARYLAIRDIGKRTRSVPVHQSKSFGSRVFGRELIAKLPKDVARHWLDVLDGKATFDRKFADQIAEGLKAWALQHGATHYTHWFQPLTNLAAEKHDSFITFRGKDLLKGEPDASSFPSGGLRVTHQARGYTVWDPTSFPFLWEAGDGMTLCLPSLFFSWSGEALDHKLPLIRSEEKLAAVVKRLLKRDVEVFATVGIEQEYFLIDRSLFLQRPDLLLANRTVFGKAPAKGQELEDHYFGSIKDRVLAFMREFEEAAHQLGIPLKTRHNEVAPAQHEVAPLFERAAIAVDHNILLMELMRGFALKHDLACLFHEKPFKGVNGSGKHCNWSIATESENLLQPKEDSLVFLTLLTAVLRAVHEHAALLRASIASAGNDHRLGGSEAPPTILSVYLGEALESIVNDLIHGKKTEISLKSIDLKIKALPHHERDSSDRNRTSFFAFTGDKFEFRAVGAPAHTALPIMVINTIVADSLQLILDEMHSLDEEAQLLVLRKHLQSAKPIIFSGNNYSKEWEEEAARRGLPNIRKSFDALHQFTEKKTVALFEDVLSEKELHSRYEILVEQYAKSVQIEANLMLEMFYTQILPAAEKDMRLRGLEEPLIGEAIHAAKELEKEMAQMSDMGFEAKGKIFTELTDQKMAHLRAIVDKLEGVVDDAMWPLPKYRELLFII